MWLARFLESLHIVSKLALKFLVRLETLPHKMDHEDVSDFSGGYCDASI